MRSLEKSQQIQVDISKVDHFLFSTEDADISIRSHAETARDDRGHSRFAVLDAPQGERWGRGAEVADAVRYINGADDLQTARERAELRRQEQNDAKYPENVRGAASGNRSRAARNAQGSAIEIDHAQILPEFDVVSAWTPRDRVIVKRMTTYFARERQIVEVEELGTYISSPTDTESIIGILTHSVCDHFGRRRFATKNRRRWWQI